MAEFRGIDLTMQLFNLSKQSNGLMTMISQQQYAASKQLEKHKKHKKNPSQMADLNSGNEQNYVFLLNEATTNPNEQLKHLNPTQLDSWEKQRLQVVINRQQKELAEHQQLQKQPSGLVINHSKVNDSQDALNILTEKDSNKTNEDNQSQVYQQVQLAYPKGQFKRQKSQSPCQDTLSTRFPERNLPTDIKNEDFDSLQQNTTSDIIPLPPKGNQLIEFTTLGHGNHLQWIQNSLDKSKVDQALSSQSQQVPATFSPQFNIEILPNQTQVEYALERPENGMVKDIAFMTPKEAPHLMENFNNLCSLVCEDNIFDDENDRDFLKQLMELEMNSDQEEVEHNAKEYIQQVKPSIIDADMQWNYSQIHSQATTQISLNFSGTPLSSPQPHTPLSFRSPLPFQKDNNSQYYACSSGKTNHQYLSS